MFLWCVFHPILKCRVPNQLTNTLDRIPSPELNFLNDQFAVLVFAVPSDLENFTRPCWAFGKTVDFLEERMLVLCGWTGAGLNLCEIQHHKIGAVNTGTYRLQFQELVNLSLTNS